MASLALLALLLTVVIMTTLVEVLPESLDQKADGSSDFKYFNKKAENVAKQLLQFLNDLDASMIEYIADLKTSSNVVKMLIKYSEAVESTIGTKCEEKEVKDQFSAQASIDTVVDTCAANASEDDKDELKNVIKKSLIKVQKADNVLRKNAELSVLPENIPSSDSVKETRKAHDDIDSILSNGGTDYIGYYFRNAMFIPQAEIEDCVDKDTKDLKDNFENWTKKVERCKLKNKL